MKKLFAALLSFVLLLQAFPALSGSETCHYAVVNNPNPADRLNLRQSPSTDSASLGKYFNGTIVNVLGAATEGWVHVSVGNTEGYMMERFLSDYPESVPSATIATVVRDPFSTMQGLAESPGGSVLILLPNDAPVVILGIAGDHAHVQTQGITGYLPLSSLDLSAFVSSDDSGRQRLAGFIQETPVSATLLFHGSYTITDPDLLQTLGSLFSGTEYWGFMMAGCPMDATLTLTYANGSSIVLGLATDSCCVFRYNGQDHYYARNLPADTDNRILFDLFGISLLY